MIELATQRLPIESFVLENMVEGIIVADEQGNIFYTNPAFDYMYDYLAGVLNGRDVPNFFSAVDTQEKGILSQIRPALQQLGFGEGK